MRIRSKVNVTKEIFESIRETVLSQVSKKMADEILKHVGIKTRPSQKMLRQIVIESDFFVLTKEEVKEILNLCKDDYYVQKKVEQIIEGTNGKSKNNTTHGI